MKKDNILKKIFVILILLAICLTNCVYALGEDNGSNGDNTNTGNDTSNTSHGSSDSNFDIYNDYSKSWGTTGNHILAAYRFDLVYKPKDGERYIIKTLVVQDPTAMQMVDSWVRTSYAQQWKDNYKNRVKAYSDFLKDKGKEFYGEQYQGSKYVNSSSKCSLVSVAGKLSKGTSIENIIINTTDKNFQIKNKENLIKWLLGDGCYGLKEKDFQEEQDNTKNHGKYLESYGYRIVVQKINLYITEASDDATRQCSTFAATRNDVVSTRSGYKDAMINYFDHYKLTNGGGVERTCEGSSYLWNRPALANISISAGDADLSNYSDNSTIGWAYPPGDLYTNYDDIGITKAKTSNVNTLKNATKKTTTKSQAKALNSTEMRNAFGSENNGLGYNIVWFSTSFTYDYSLDAACTNCKSKDEENKSLIIQDTTNWDAIKESNEYEAKTSKITDHIKTYYYKTKKGYNVYCREEYLVNFPNANDRINVNTGRYFTVNASDESLKQAGISSEVNFKPIKVTKKRECRGNDLSKFSSSKTVQKEFLGDTGKVYIKYTENTPDSHYSMKDKLELERYDNYDEGSYINQINGNTLTMQVTYSYTLKENYYRYISIKDGLSIEKSWDVKDTSRYTDVGISNLPISYNNNSKRAAELQFAYDLPTNDSYTKISDAYNKGQNNYLRDTSKSYQNIYTTYTQDSSSVSGDDVTQLQQSACAKMYGYGTSGFKTCAKERTINKTGDNGSANKAGNYDANCYTKLNGNIDSTDKKASSKGYSCIVDGNNDCEYDPDTGKFYDASHIEITKEQYNNGDCNSSNSCHYDSKNNKYYNSSGEEVTEEVYNRQCSCRIDTDNNGNSVYYDRDNKKITQSEWNQKCCPSDCEYGCCPSGQCAPMPTVNGMIVCPYGSKKVIYRTIDLSDPFPGQNADRRKTGSNWCYYDIKKQTLDCSWNNLTSSKVIRKENKKTTDEGNGTSIYKNEKGIYEVTLDSDKINAIREYNDSNKYDDFTLDCKDNGRACISEWFRKYLDGGECANSTRSDFYTCDDD